MNHFLGAKSQTDIIWNDLKTCRRIIIWIRNYVWPLCRGGGMQKTAAKPSDAHDLIQHPAPQAPAPIQQVTLCNFLLHNSFELRACLCECLNIMNSAWRNGMLCFDFFVSCCWRVQFWKKSIPKTLNLTAKPFVRSTQTTPVTSVKMSLSPELTNNNYLTSPPPPPLSDNKIVTPDETARAKELLTQKLAVMRVQPASPPVRNGPSLVSTPASSPLSSSLTTNKTDVSVCVFDRVLSPFLRLFFWMFNRSWRLVNPSL